MTASTAAKLEQSLDVRLEAAVSHAMREMLRTGVRRLSNDEQIRHTGRMLTCQAPIAGEGWLGSLMLLLPSKGGRDLVLALGDGPAAGFQNGPDIAEGLGRIAARIALGFGAAFAHEQSVTVSMPTVIEGTDVSVSFAWGKHFEARQAFMSGPTPFWVILRLSRTRPSSS